ncbi:MAG: deoxyribodipyrimidine photo-lyase [Actinobacteria bacterium]|nr:MAG: deoxyribodipyrimidine photo-lyase [Actinomycetota bacterium]
MPSLHWFRRDLRFCDNPALDAAGPDAVGVFIHDPRLRDVGTVRAEYLGEALDELGAQRPLTVRTGDPAEVLREVAEQHGARDVYCTGDTTPFSLRRDREVSAALASAGITVHSVDTPYAIPPGEVLNGSGTAYRVFTPFYKAWLARGWPAPAGAVTESPALARWRAFREDALATYKKNRDFPALSATSRLSTALHFGQIHPRTILAEIPDVAIDPFARQLAWREFCADILWHQPQAVWSSLDTRFDTDMKYDHDDDLFEAWAQGRTGYPFVDAGMRQLATEGWMHNRLRMVTASFLVKDLHQPWQRGAAWFMKHLVDADVANNQLGWQWVAGCGTDAAPYFRIFNPVTQGRRFDPNGDYIRRYVPELADVPDPHEPGVFAPDYPAPVVNHARERDVALSRFQALPSR